MQRALQIALTLSLIGVFSLALLAQFYEPEQIPIANLAEHKEEIVIIQGRVVKATQKPTVNFFEVKDNTGTITVVAFDKMDKLDKRLLISVKGKVTTYKGKLELIADRMEII